jgi:hypothetical protein
MPVTKIPLQNDLEYMDDNAEKLGRQKMRSDAMKRQFAIHGRLPALSCAMSKTDALCRLQKNSESVGVV